MITINDKIIIIVISTQIRGTLKVFTENDNISFRKKAFPYLPRNIEWSASLKQLMNKTESRICLYFIAKNAPSVKRLGKSILLHRLESPL